MQGTHFDGIHDQFLQIILRLSFTKFCNIHVSQFCERTKTDVVKLQKKHCKHSIFFRYLLALHCTQGVYFERKYYHSCQRVVKITGSRELKVNTTLREFFGSTRRWICDCRITIPYDVAWLLHKNLQLMSTISKTLFVRSIPLGLVYRVDDQVQNWTVSPWPKQG